MSIMTDTPRSITNRTRPGEREDIEAPSEHLTTRNVNSAQGSLSDLPPNGIIYIDWEEEDPRHPANYTRARKWAITLTACVLTAMASAIAGTYSMGYPSMMRDLNCTMFQATLGLSAYPLGSAIFPLILAPLSEEFGRQPLYIGATILMAAMHLGIALANNIQSVIVFRFLLGAAGSTGSTMVGGTIADIWAPYERGIPMAVLESKSVEPRGRERVRTGCVLDRRVRERSGSAQRARGSLDCDWLARDLRLPARHSRTTPARCSDPPRFSVPR
ncbi:major facilitator superfamily domain-containing protein [Phellopilus nigrolimitatus]|nr:major facilitator superfamily domain-containing protein [Phellopilus nigrolimitatus]